MQHTKKMTIVPQDLIDTLRFNQKRQLGPEGQFKMNLDQELKNILERKDIASDEKVQLYFQSLQRYVDNDDRSAPPRLILEPPLKPAQPLPIQTPVNPVPSTTPTMSVSDQTTPKDQEQDIVDSLPKKSQRKAGKLLNWIRTRHPEIQWNDQGELTTHPGSNIVDLIDELTRPQRRVKFGKPPGFQELASKLRTGHVPRTLIGNADTWKEIFPESVDPLTPPSSPVPRKKKRVVSRPIWRRL